MHREYDGGNALLTFHAGAGGTEAQDWVEMLMRMYMRWAGRRGYGVELLDSLEGEGAGLKSATIAIRGADAYDLLRTECGVHRLVRQSPFDSQNRRHTTFALVDVSPEIGEMEKLMAAHANEDRDIGWTSPIRSYVFHPYSLVKDHRADIETGNIQAVMDGDLDQFIGTASNTRANVPIRF